MDQRRWDEVRLAFDEIVDLDEHVRRHRLATLETTNPELYEAVVALLSADAEVEARLGLVESAFLPRGASSETSVPDLYELSGRTLSHFRVDEPLGAGGMGIVYRAEDLRLGRAVAVKLLLPQHTRDPELTGRFLREARLLAALDHPNLCSIHEVGVSDESVPFFAMPLYAGETLHTRLAMHGPLSPPQALEIAQQILQGLLCAHDAGLVHRDLKPGNVMLLPNGSAKILDFGLAKAGDQSLSEHGSRAGTVAYMSPEQLRGERVDARTDLWSFGVVLFEMLTGTRPAPGRSPMANRTGEVSQAHAAIPKQIRRVVERLLQEDPRDRYRDSREALTALQASATDSGVAADWPPFFRRPLAGAVALLLVVGIAGLGVWTLGPARSQQRQSVQSPPVSLAVLPLRNEPPDSTDAYFAEGLTDQLTTTLSELESIRVISHQSAVQVSGRDRPISEIARLLDVQYIVNGVVVRDNGRIRLDVTVVDAKRNEPLGSYRVERDAREVVGLQHAAALAITQATRATLSARDLALLREPPAIDPAAFEYYLKGTKARYYASQTNNFTQAAEYYGKAIERDSTYAPPYAGLAFIHAMTQSGAQARKYATTALRLDSSLADAHIALGMVRQMLDWDWAGAEAALRDAIRLNPGHAEAHHELSMLLMRQRRFDEAVREAQTALQLAPVSVKFEIGMAEVSLAGGRYSEAIAAADRAAAIDTGYHWAPNWSRGWMHLAEKRYQESLELLSDCNCDFRRPIIGYLLGRLGRRKEAIAISQTLKREWRQRRGQPGEDERALGVASVLIGLHENDEAVMWVERAAVSGTFIVYLAIDPIFTPLYADPRFQAVLDRIGLGQR